MEGWVLFALLAMAFNAAKVMASKTICRATNPSVLVFYARLVPAAFLFFPAYYSDYSVHNTVQFWGATVSAALLTLAASVLYVKALQTGNLSLVAPLQSSVPVFMIVTTYVLYDEKPELGALLLIVSIAVSVSYVVLKSSRRKGGVRDAAVVVPVFMSLAASGLYGVSTVLDRVALSATTNGAIYYSACWNVTTVMLLSVYLLRSRRLIIQESRCQYAPILTFAVVSAVAFVFQQISVQESLDMSNGVTYVKAIVMIHIGICALLGIVLLKEKVSPGILISNAIALASGVALVLVV